MNRELRLKQCFQYCEHAAEKLRAAGFVLNYISMKSEACYYEHPARKGYVIRVAAHRYSRTEDKLLPHHIGKMIACITFAPGCFNNIPKSWEAIDAVIYKAVGQYFIKDLPSRLRQKEAA